MGNEASLAAFLGRIRGEPKQITVYGPLEYDDLAPFLARFNVELVHKTLPIPAESGYLTVREDEQFLGSIPATAFDELIDPPREAPWDPETRESAFRDLTRLLKDTGVTTTDRRHLLAVSRELEDRAYRVGRGQLHVGFQSLSVARTQLSVYEQLVGDTDLEITVYGDADWEVPDQVDVTVRTTQEGELGTFWLVAFDGGPVEEMSGALVAEEFHPNEYRGGWTDDHELVGDLISHLENTYG